MEILLGYKICFNNRYKTRTVVSASLEFLANLVEDDGTKHNEYADSFCEILSNHVGTTNWIKVVKVILQKIQIAIMLLEFLFYVMTFGRKYDNPNLFFYNFIDQAVF